MAVEFIALLMLTLYSSPSCCYCAVKCGFCVVSARELGHRRKVLSSALFICYYSEFPISELGEYFRSLTGCMSSCIVIAVSRGFVLAGGLRCVRLPSVLEGGIKQSQLALQFVL